MSTEAVTDRYRGLRLVADGDGYILGTRHSTDFVAVPRVGGLVVQWLQDGHDLAECARRAEEAAGEPVDVAGFVAELESAGLLAEPGAEAAAEPDRPPRGQRLGRILFGRVGVSVHLALIAIGAWLLLTRPGLRPVFSDAAVTSVPLVSILIMTAIAISSGLIHELMHLLAAAARGVPSSISMGRRLWSIVYQTDLSRLWMVPRRQRLLPLAAGMLSDAALMGLLLVLLAGPLDGADPLLVAVLRAIILGKFGGLVFQAEIFMRTDLYAMLVVVSGCRNLWATKGAVARRLIGRATPEDLAHLDAVGRREVRWGTAYLVLYLPGVTLATWFFVSYGLPAMWLLLGMSVTAVAQHGLLSPLGVAGAVATALSVIPTGLMLFGAGRNAVRVLRYLRRGLRRPERAAR